MKRMSPGARRVLRTLVSLQSRACTRARSAIARGGLRPVPWDELRRIVILDAGGLGDAICALPAFRHVRHRCPQARLELCTKPLARSFLETYGLFDEIHDRPGYLPSRADLVLATIWGMLSYWGNIRFAADQAAGYLWDTRPRASGCRLAGQARDGREIHLVRVRFQVLELLGETPDDAPFPPPLSSRALRGAETFLDARLERRDGPLIALATHSPWRQKTWPGNQALRFARDALAAGYRVVLLGSASEREAALGWSESLAQDPGWGFGVGELSLMEVSALLTRCDLLVTVDSGVMHLASALGVPVLALFGPTDPARCGPYWGTHRILRGMPEGAGRYDGFRYPECPPDATLVDVDAETAMRAASAMIEGAAAATPDGTS